MTEEIRTPESDIRTSESLPVDTASRRLSVPFQLRNSSALILGLRWTGIEVSKHLCTAGIGKLIIIDDDATVVADAERTIARHIKERSAATVCVAQHMVFDAAHAERLIESSGIIIDCLKDWQSKLLASDVCMNQRKTLVHAGGSGMRFQIYTMRPGKSACLRCAFPAAGIDDFPLTVSDDIVFEPIVSMAAAMQAIESIKFLGRWGVSQGNELWKYDGLSGECEIIRGLDPKRDCPDCGRIRSH